MTAQQITPALIARQIPALPIQVYRCPNCRAEEIRPNFSYCPHCGFEMDMTPIVLESLFDLDPTPDPHKGDS